MYSYSQTFWKGFKHVIVGMVGLAVVATVVSGVDHLTIWDVLVKYAQPVLSTISVSAILTMILNWAKNR